jgi:hypothetical protein
VKVTKTQAEIDDLYYAARDTVDTGKTKFSGMTYEEGIVNAIEWLQGEYDGHPYKDEDEDV